MKYYISILLLFIFFACSTNQTQNERAGVSFIDGTFDQAVKLAGSSSKHILVDFYTDW